ncbi:MAG: ABC transporter ATP-binding protein/permease [Chitinophagales bacterium]|nr:ABC transporter ATP-binding protein/permease [Chitinophagales bacterium]
MPTSKSLIYDWLSTHIARVLAILIIGITSSLLTIFLSLVIAQSYTMLFGLNSSRGQLLNNVSSVFENFSFQEWMQVLLGVIAFKAGFEYLFNKFKGLLSEAILVQLRKDLFNHQLLLHPQLYQEKGGDRYLLRFSGDLSSVQNFISRGILQFISDLVLLLTGLAFISYFNLLISSLIVFFILSLWLIVYKINQQIGKVESHRRNKKSGLLAVVAKSFRNLNTIKVFNQKNIYGKRFDRRAEDLYTLGKEFQSLRAGLNSTISGGVYLLMASVLLAVSWIQKTDTLIDSTYLFAVVIILISWRPSINRLLRVGLVWKKGMISLRKLEKLLIQPKEENLDLPVKKIKVDALEVKNLDYRIEKEYILNPISFSAKIGELLLIRGSAGSGKSTLVKLLTGFLSASDGDIQFNGENTTTLNPTSIRRVISVHTKFFPLIGKNVGEAICRERNRERRAFAQEILKKWSDSFELLEDVEMDTPLSTLSENQHTLLQWVRLLVHDRSIWILDEPFPKVSLSDKRRILSMIETYRSRKLILLLSCGLEPELEVQVNANKVVHLNSKENLLVNAVMDDKSIFSL